MGHESKRMQRDRIRRLVWAGWLMALAFGGWLKLLIWPDPYAASEATLAQVIGTFEGGVRGWPLLGLAGVWAAAVAAPAEGVALGRSARARPRSSCSRSPAPGWFLGRRSRALARRDQLPAVGRAVFAPLLPCRRLSSGAARLCAAAGSALVHERSRAGLAGRGASSSSCSARNHYMPELFRAARARGRRLAQRHGCRRRAFPWIHGTALDHWGLQLPGARRRKAAPRACSSGIAMPPPPPPLRPLGRAQPGRLQASRRFPRGWFRWGICPGCRRRIRGFARTASGFAPN